MHIYCFINFPSSIKTSTSSISFLAKREWAKHIVVLFVKSRIKSIVFLN
ncbi:TPA: hypothetical protein F6V94_23295 [Serratia marcescens]|nr:hypothetical protein [Serratia marcescens]HAT4996043.1 hypothetical protein [Serratia marcescens]HAU4403398.1 hypothetical protein [Serratia marcescens]HAU5649264.1 hypothetical protein [Serratia marcescens]